MTNFPSRPQYGPPAEHLARHIVDRIHAPFWAVIARSYQGDGVTRREHENLGRLLGRHD